MAFSCPCRIPFARLYRGLLLCMAIVVIGVPASADEPTAPPAPSPQADLAQFFGFSGLEVYKIDPRVLNLRAAELNGDGRSDLIMIDNFSSCLRLMLQKTADAGGAAATAPPAPPAAVTAGATVNDTGSDHRFEERRLPLDRAVAAIELGDFNGDGRADIAAIGAPDQFSIRFQPAPGVRDWSDVWKVRLPDLEPTSGMLAVGDLNGDGRDDAAIIGKDCTWLILQGAAGEMQSPRRLLNTSPRQALLRAADLNGDGRSDLSYVFGEASARELGVRLQTPDGRLGPELSFAGNPPRAVTVAAVDTKAGSEITTIDSRTGRIQVRSLMPPEDSTDGPSERLVHYGIGPGTTNRDRSAAIADFDGDGRSDLILNDPEQAQLLLCRQNGIDGLGAVEEFPSLVGITDLAAGDLNQDGRPEIVVISSREGVVARTEFVDGRLTFPEVLLRKPEGWDLAAIALVPGPRGLRIVLGLTQGTGNAAKLQYIIHDRADDGSWKPADGSQPVELTGAVGPKGVKLTALDVNGDQRPELLSIANGAAKAGMQVLEVEDEGGLIAASQTSQLDPGITGPGRAFVRGGQLYVARDNFARRLTFGSGGWKVEDQFNAGEASAKLEGVAALNLDGQPGDEVVLVDTGVKKLRILRQEGMVYRPWKEIDPGSLQYSSMLTADLNSDGREDLVMLGSQQFGVLYCGVAQANLREVASFESARDKAFPADVTIGDINGDGQTDLTVIDTSIDGLAIVAWDDRNGLREATHFRVFEEKRLVSQAENRGTQPREVIVADVTGDGRSDLLLLCHDRLLLYPQDSGVPPETAVQN